MALHVPAIEGALGRPLAADALYVTADTGLRYRDQTLYRRAQPGRAGLNRMETALDAGGHDVTGVGAAEGFTASVSGDAEAGGAGSVAGDAATARLGADIAGGRRPRCRLPHGIGGAHGRARGGGTGHDGHGVGERPARYGRRPDRCRRPDG